MWQPTINYLNKKIPSHHFTLETLKLEQTTKSMKQNSIDFIITNPGNYIDLESHFGISRLATLKTKKQNKTSNQFAAIIFTKNNRDDIQTLEDLRNKSFMGVNKKAFGGFQMAWLEFKNTGIDPFEDFSSLQFSGLPQDKIVYAVLNGKIDAGTVRTTTLERMAAEGLIDITKLKILNRKINSNFPSIHSTQLYPEWLIAKARNTSFELAKKVSIALLKLPENSIVAKKARSSGWTVPLDYSPVHNLFKELNLAPYNIVLPGFFERYWGQLLLFLMLFLQPLFLYIRKLRIDLSIDEEKFAQAETEWSNALDFLDEPMYMVDLNDRIIRANKAFYKKINTQPENAIGKVVTDFTHPEGEKIPCKVCQARKDLIDTVIILEADDPANKPAIPMEISVKIIHNNNNQPIGIIQRMRDLTESRKAEKALRRSESLFKELLNATPAPLFVAKSDGTIILVNSRFEEEFGYSREEIIGYKVEKLIPEKYRSKHIGIRAKYSFHPTDRPMGRDLHLEGLHKNGHTFPIDISLNPFTIDNEILIISTIHNISEQLEKESELKRLASFPELSPNPIVEFTKDGTIAYVNPATFIWFPNIIDTGVKHELFSNINPDFFSNIDNEYSLLEENHELIRNIQIADSTYEQKIIYNPKTKLFRTYVWDITKLRNLTQKLTYQATHDALTNLINRREFERRLEQAAEETKFNNKNHSLCYMDLDQFKAVNDSCGHAAGDELLKQLSSKINSTIRAADTFARLGGDEFGLLLIGCPIDKAAIIAEEVRKTVEDFRFHWDKKTFKVGVSIGIVILNKQSGSLKDIQSAADTACYIAKEQGRNRIHIYEADSTATAKHANETNWLNRINIALDNDKFILYFQKIVSVNNNAHEHYEVLIRMIDED
ncbi:MAG: diguanylate cyclase, partial [Gammaproteobacteria bacterium]|nr:diguanylate cyclase [Gammaproteobacteria bacterium]